MYVIRSWLQTLTRRDSKSLIWCPLTMEKNNGKCYIKYLHLYNEFWAGIFYDWVSYAIIL